MKLLTSQKDEIFDLIDSNNFFSPSQFEVEEFGVKGKGRVTTRLNFRNSEYYVWFLDDERYYNSFYLNICPGVNSYAELTDAIAWDSMISYIMLWLDSLRRELTTPNKWERVLKEVNNTNIKISNSNDEGNFSYLEYTDLVKRMDLLNNKITTLSLPLNQQKIIIDKLNQLTTIAQNLNKVNWKNLFIGTIISIIIQLEVSRENAAEIWELIRQVFHNFFLPK